MDFDITSLKIPPTPAAGQPEANDGGMEFTLDFPVEKPVPAAQPAEVGFGGINLNLDDVGAPGGSAPEVKDEHWHEVATKLDLAKAYLKRLEELTGARVSLLGVGPDRNQTLVA